HVEHLLALLNFVRMLEERADHPGVSENQIQALNRVVGCHDHGTGAGVGWSPGETAGDGFGLPPSVSSLENSTRKVPAATSKMPSGIFHPGISRWKIHVSPVFGLGCQTRLKTVLMSGARAKISGAM